MICIPFFADQRFNSAVMEYMGVGLWNQHSKFADTFAKQLDQLLEHGESNKYYQKIMQVAKAIHNSPPQQKTFLDAVNKIIEEDYSECTNLPLSEKAAAAVFLAARHSPPPLPLFFCVFKYARITRLSDGLKNNSKC
uniref:Glucuronosyltransferase n=1 Tax=Ditylenchus dipsaci TaxID=166011 RepID=A0A915EGV6_9BILA